MPWNTTKTNWVSTDYYNFSDLNRVENNIDYVRTVLIALGYTIPSITTNTGRTNLSYDTIDSINRVESNLNTIKNNFVTPSTWTEGQTWSLITPFSYTDANRWESNVQALYDLSITIPQSFRYSGTFNLAQEVLPQL